MRRIMCYLVAVMCLAMLLGGCGPTTPPADISAVEAALAAKNYDQAALLLETIIAAEPNHAEAHFLLGLANFNLGRHAQAQTAFRRSLELDDERAAAIHHNLGALAYQINDYETAVAEFTAALQFEPNDPDTHYQLGAAYLILAIPENSFFPDEALLLQAQEEFETALHLAPSKPEALVGLGNVYLLQNRLPDAIAILEQAAAENPSMLEALFGLGRAYAIAGNNAAAQETLQAFLALNPPEVWAEQAREILTMLGP